MKKQMAARRNAYVIASSKGKRLRKVTKWTCSAPCEKGSIRPMQSWGTGIGPNNSRTLFSKLEMMTTKAKRKGTNLLKKEKEMVPHILIILCILYQYRGSYCLRS